MNDHVSSPVASSFHFGDCMTHSVYRMKHTSYRNDTVGTDKNMPRGGTEGEFDFKSTPKIFAVDIC